MISADNHGRRYPGQLLQSGHTPIEIGDRGPEDVEQIPRVHDQVGAD